MINAGADIIDIGGESTRPGSKIILTKIECKELKSNKKFKKNFLKLYYQ
jgi:dihydropteroate synthase